MQFPSALLAAALLSCAANAAAVSPAAAPVATAASHHIDNSMHGHHVKFTGFDGPQCNKEHDQKDFELNVDGNCKKLRDMHYRSLKVKKASSTWHCNVKLYSDELCKDQIGGMPGIDTEANGTCWAWVGDHEGAEIEAKSGRMTCGHPDEMEDSNVDADSNDSNAGSGS